MQQEEKFNDWLFRYRYVYRVRRTDKNKRRFLQALVTDIASMREDVRVIEYNQQKKTASRNVYVGNVKKADRIICTYYDTPLAHFGGYRFFDRQVQGKRTTNLIILSSILMILLGLAGTLLYMKLATAAFDLSSLYTWLFIAIFGLYFFALGKVTQGLSRRKNVIRNTSSVLALLRLMEAAGPNTAFAFLDEGTYGDNGLEVLRSSTKKQAQIIYLDSIGANEPLQVIGSGISKGRLAEAGLTAAPGNDVTYVISGSVEGTGYELTKTAMKQDLNMENLMTVTALLK